MTLKFFILLLWWIHSDKWSKFVRGNFCYNSSFSVKMPSNSSVFFFMFSLSSPSINSCLEAVSEKFKLLEQYAIARLLPSEAFSERRKSRYDFGHKWKFNSVCSFWLVMRYFSLARNIIRPITLRVVCKGSLIFGNVFWSKSQYIYNKWNFSLSLEKRVKYFSTRISSWSWIALLIIETPMKYQTTSL